MIQLLLGVTLALFLILQFVIKRKRRIKTEVVIYESSSVKGRLFSLTKKGNIVGAVLVVLILAIGIPGYLSYSSYHKIKNLIDLENYSEARSKIEEYEQGVVPVFRVDKLEYTLKLNWAKSAIESKNWVEAVENLGELYYNDSIPQDLIPKAFIAYYEYINSQIPIYPPKPFDSSSRFFDEWGTNTQELFTYNQYLSHFKIDSAVIQESYIVYEKLKRMNTVESVEKLAVTTRKYEYFDALLEMNNDSNLIIQIFRKDPRIVISRIEKDISREDYIGDLVNVGSASVSLLKSCISRGYRDEKLMIDLGKWAIHNDWRYPVFPGLKDYAIKKYFNSTLDSSWGKNDFYTEIKILRYYLGLNEFSQKNKEQKLVQFLKTWNEKEMNKEYINLLNKKRELSECLDKENNWILTEDYWNYLQGKEFGFVRGLSLEQAESLFASGEYVKAAFWQRYALSLNEFVPYHNSFLPMYNGSASHWPYTSDYEYYFLAEIIWKMGPTGIKDGYCEALEKSMELGFERASQKWFSNCR